MKSSKPVIVLGGQVYYDEAKNEYLVVQRKNGEVVVYQGRGFRGMLEDQLFLERFQPVDPADLNAAEVRYLTDFCPEGTTLKVGFIND